MYKHNITDLLDSLAKQVNEMPLPMAIEEHATFIKFRDETLKIIEQCRHVERGETLTPLLWSLFTEIAKSMLSDVAKEGIIENWDSIISLLKEFFNSN